MTAIQSDRARRAGESLYWAEHHLVVGTKLLTASPGVHLRPKAKTADERLAA